MEGGMHKQRCSLLNHNVMRTVAFTVNPNFSYGILMKTQWGRNSCICLLIFCRLFSGASTSDKETAYEGKRLNLIFIQSFALESGVKRMGVVPASSAVANLHQVHPCMHTHSQVLLLAGKKLTVARSYSTASAAVTPTYPRGGRSLCWDNSLDEDYQD